MKRSDGTVVSSATSLSINRGSSNLNNDANDKAMLLNSDASEQ